MVYDGHDVHDIKLNCSESGWQGQRKKTVLRRKICRTRRNRRFAKKLSCVQHLPPTPTPCPTFSTPSQAWVSLLTHFEPSTAEHVWYTYLQLRLRLHLNLYLSKLWRKKHDKDICTYVHLHRARTDPAGWLLTWNSPPEASPSSQFKWTPPPPLHRDSSAVYERWDVRQSCPGQPVVATVGKAGGRSVQCSPSTLAALVRPVLCPPPPHKDGRYCAALSLRAQLAVVPYTLPLLLLHICNQFCNRHN